MFYSLQLGDLLWNSKQDVWTGLSDGLKSYFSKSVASIILFNGDYTLSLLSFLTSIYCNATSYK
jgi:hypothetical protein